MKRMIPAPEDKHQPPRPRPAERRVVHYARRRWRLLARRGAWMLLERRGVREWVHAACVT